MARSHRRRLRLGFGRPPTARCIQRFAALATGLGASTVLASACASPEPADTQPPVATVSVLAEGGPLNGTNGLMFGPDGRLYVASVASAALSAIDPESGEILEQWGPSEGVIGPDDLTFGADGSLFWTDILVGSVGRRDPDGTSRVVGSPGPGVNPITFSDDGRLFVSQCFLGDHLFEIDPDGVDEPRLISDQLGPGCGLNGMDWGPDGKLYGPRWFHAEVVRVDVDTGEVESVASGFQAPAAVKFDSQDRLHVLDTLAGEVVRVDLASGSREVIGRPGLGLDNLAFDANDYLFVSSFTDSFVVEITGPDTVREVVKGGISVPGGLAYVAAPDDSGQSGRLFLADFFALRQLDPVTGAQTHVVRDVIGFSELGQVMSVNWDGEHLILSEWFNSTVKVWDPESDRLIASFGGFQRPIDAVASGTQIVVTEYDTGSVLRFDRAAPDDRTTIASGLQAPAGLAERDGDLFVTDRDAGTLLQIAAAEELLDPPHVVVSGLAGPEGVTPASDGGLYLVEADAGRVVRVDPQDGTLTEIVDGLELRGPDRAGAPSLGLLNDVAVGDGELFVSGDARNRVYRIGL